MKRASGDGENAELGSKKVRFFDENDRNFIDLDSNGGEGERNSAENGAGGVGPEHVDSNANLFENVCSDSFGGVEGVSKWDFDINFDMIFGYEEEQKGLALDLNRPLFNTNPNETFVDRGTTVVDLVSDEDESEVEIVGYTHGNNSTNQLGYNSTNQLGLGMPSGRVEELNLGLGLHSMDNVVGESSNAREEKGKGSDIDSWLSLKASYLVDLDPDSDVDEIVPLVMPQEEVEVFPRLREAMAAANELSERELRDRRYAARQLARVRILDEDREEKDISSSKKNQLPTPNPIEQHLGKLPGPFSDALKMVRERVSKQKIEQLIKWKPSEKIQERSIASAFVPSLLNLSLKALAESAEGIVSLEVVPDCLRGRLTNRVCDLGKINAGFSKLLVEGCPTAIRLKNCSWMTEEQFQQTIGECETKDLQVLQLDLCGQCRLDIGFKNILNRRLSSFSRLTILSLRGACRLSDDGLRYLAMAAPRLRSINLGQCTLLTSDCVNYIADVLGSNLRELYIDECLKIDGKQILQSFKKFRCLEVLSVAELPTINDQFVIGLVMACGQSLKELDFASCIQLTDYSLKAIGECCSDLCSLNISNLNNMTDLGLEYLANGCRKIQKLKLRCNDFSDESVAAFLESSGESLLELLLNNMAKVGPHTALSLAKRSRKLLSLDISWCRRISNEALGLIVDGCSSLKLLKIFGCRQITNVFLEGHSNPFVRIIGSNFTPIFDHLDLLEPEEMFLKYSPLPFI